MRLTVEMSLDPYGRMLEACSQLSEEFKILKSAIEDVQKENRSERILQIACDEGQVQAILALAYRVCPDAVSAIRTRMVDPGEQ